MELVNDSCPWQMALTHRLPGPAYASSCAAASISWSYQLDPHERTDDAILVTKTGSSTFTGIETWTTSEATQCDGILRFQFGSDFDFVPKTTNIYSTWTRTFWSRTLSVTSAPEPSCYLQSADCIHIYHALSSSFEADIDRWSDKNEVTVSLASPPSAVVINGQTTHFPNPQATPPILTIHNQTYSTISGLPSGEIAFSISDALVVTSQDTLRPGGSMVVQYNYDELAYLTRNRAEITCDALDLDNTASKTESCTPFQGKERWCRIFALSVDLLYFAPPSTSRDLCADTTPGYNRCECNTFSISSVSILILIAA
jgi:hypothetical protein